MPAKTKPVLKKKPSAKTRRVTCEDFTREIDGEVYHPHADEWVELAPVGIASGEIRALFAMDDYRSRRSDDRKQLDVGIAQMHRALARRVVAWNWTDDLGRPVVPWNASDPETGEPYARLDGSQTPFEALEVGELLYLRNLSTGEGPAERKNGSDA